MTDWRRSVRTAMGTGKIVAVDPSGPVGRAQVRLSQYELFHSIPILGVHGQVSEPLPGADAVLLFQGRDRSNPILVGHGDQRYRLRDQAGGTLGWAHHLGHSLLLTAAGIEVDGHGLPVTVRNASKVRIEGDLEVTGEVRARCDGSAVTLSQHVHPEHDGGSTSKPTPGT